MADIAEWQDFRIAGSEGKRAKGRAKGPPIVQARKLHRVRRMDKTAEALKVRTKRFAIAVLDFVDTLPRTPSGDAIARQLARSGLGVAGNYRGSCRARSHAEFTARLGVVLEEADESQLWLEVCNDRKMGDATQRPSLIDESGQLCAIFSKGCTTARIREYGKRDRP